VTLRARVALALAAAGLGVGAPPRAAAGDAPAPVLLEGFPTVQGIRFADADGDGLLDLMLLQGRRVRIWRGVKGGSLAPAPTWTFSIPEEATFAWPGAPSGEGAARTPTLTAIGRGGVLRLLPGPPAAVEGGFVALSWADPARAVLTDFVQGAGAFLPTDEGLRWVPDFVGAAARSLDLVVPPRRKVTAPGAFLEESAVATWEWPAPVVSPAWAPTGAPAVFLLGADGLHAFSAGGEKGDKVREAFWPTAFLPPVVDGRLVIADLDGDGTPDVCHEAATNATGTYTYFRTPPPAEVPVKPDASTPPKPSGDLRPARGMVKLTGFQFPPDYVDLDGDGRRDIAITTIEIDGGNIMRAIVSGRVVAKTRAFLNRSKSGATEWFGAPDAEVASDILVKLRFTFSGSIEVQRSFTIVAGADLDGDGRKDLVIRSSPETLAVRRGVADGVWASEPATIRIPPMGKSPDVEAYAADLTGDGKDDLVLLYKAPPGGSDVVVFLRSP
jgi:hypothetical protein